MPDIFLEWNAEDPVSDFERARNEIAYDLQGNRNPFIDNPALATKIWSGPQSEDTWGILEVQDYEEEKDRKSTRLNSSHVAISYAVFCLKKKITKNKKIQRYS